MRKYTLLVVFALSLAGCAEGWSTRLTSTYGIEPPPTGIIPFSNRYNPALIYPGLLVDDALYLRLYYYNDEVLSPQPAPAGESNWPFYIYLMLSSKRELIAIDTSSFVLERGGDFQRVQPKVSTTNRRIAMKSKDLGIPFHIVCDFPYKDTTKKGLDSLITVPNFDGELWPPQSDDDSVLCLSLFFPITRDAVPPEKQFQLHFRYFLDGKTKDVTLYFYPLKFRKFSS